MGAGVGVRTSRTRSVIGSCSLRWDLSGVALAGLAQRDSVAVGVECGDADAEAVVGRFGFLEGDPAGLESFELGLVDGLEPKGALGPGREPMTRSSTSPNGPGSLDPNHVVGRCPQARSSSDISCSSAVVLFGVLGGTPDTYRPAGLKRGTATSTSTMTGTTSSVTSAKVHVPST